MGGVFDHAELMGRGKRLEGIEIERLAKEVHRHDCTSLRTDLPGSIRKVDIEGVRIDVDPDRGRAEAGHGACGSKEGKGRQEDLVAFTDIKRHEREQERIRTGGDAEGVLYAEESGAVLLKGLEPGAHDEHIRAKDIAEGGLELALEGAVLRAEIKERDVRHGAREFSHRPPTRATSFSRATGAKD